MSTHKEGLLLVVEDASALGPVPLHAGGLEVLVAGDEQEVVIHQLLSDGLLHPGEGEILAGEITLELGKGGLHESLHLDPLLLGDAGAQAESLDAATHADPGGLDGHVIVDVAADLGRVHVTGVGGVGGDAVVLLDDGVEHGGEVLVGVAVPGVDAAVLVIEVDSAGDGLGQSEAGRGGLVGGELVPLLLGDVLSHQGVLGLDSREFGHC